MSTPTPHGDTGNPENPQTQYGQNEFGQTQYGQPQHGQQAYGEAQYGQTQQLGQTPHQQNQYGQPAYGQSQYAQAQYGQPQYGQAPAPQAIPFATYGSRVGAYLLDGLLSVIPMLLLGGLGLWIALKDAHEVRTDAFDPASGTGSVETSLEGINGAGFAVAGLGVLLSLVFQVWNRGLRQGKTGQSLGKKVTHIKVVDECTGLPAGAGAGLGRFGVEFGFGIVNAIVGILSLLDLLWPLWDSKKQTLHDKIVHTVVVQGD